MLPKKYKWSFLYTLQQACMVTGQTFPSLFSTVILPNVISKALMEPFVHAPASMLGNWTNVIFFEVSTIILPNVILKPLIEPFVHAPANMLDNGTNAKIGFLGGISKVIQTING